MTYGLTKISADGLDLDMLRRKYAEERDRRVNPRRNEQFVEIAGEYSHFDDNPWMETPSRRDPVSEVVDVLVIGGGIGGLTAAVELRKAGIDNFRIVDKASDFGGVWYWNRYPGAQCDIESYIYLPYLEETGYVPKEKYAYAPEIWEHLRRIAKHYRLYDRAFLQTQVDGMVWQEEERRWAVTTDRGDTLLARYVFSASGLLNRPKLPGIPGINRFKGRMLHTSRWDYGYTGGDHSGGLSGLSGKPVAIIGTGATAIQCVPFVAKDAEHLYVVQRTPANVGARGNRPTSAEWAASLEPGWQRDRMNNFNERVLGFAEGEDLVHDAWTELFYDLATAGAPREGEELSPGESMRRTELMDFIKGEEARARVDALVSRPEAAEGLKPWYGVLCKRPAFNDEYLPTFNRDNVTLIDTAGQGLDEISETGIVYDGVEYPVDCIIFGTGFEVGTDYSRRAGFTIRGVGGKTLTEHFENGPRSFHGFYVHGFPNLFLLGAGQNGVKRNFTDMLLEHAEHIVGVIKDAQRIGATRIEATEKAEADWMQTLIDKSQDIRHFLANCTPSYLNGEGDVDNSFVANTYGGGPIEFTHIIQQWRKAGKFSGLDVQ